MLHGLTSPRNCSFSFFNLSFSAASAPEAADGRLPADVHVLSLNCIDSSPTCIWMGSALLIAVRFSRSTSRSVEALADFLPKDAVSDLTPLAAPVSLRMVCCA